MRPVRVSPRISFWGWGRTPTPCVAVSCSRLPRARSRECPDSNRNRGGCLVSSLRRAPYVRPLCPIRCRATTLRSPREPIPFGYLVPAYEFTAVRGDVTLHASYHISFGVVPVSPAPRRPCVRCTPDTISTVFCRPRRRLCVYTWEGNISITSSRMSPYTLYVFSSPAHSVELPCRFSSPLVAPVDITF